MRLPGAATRYRSSDADLLVSEGDPLSALALLGVRGRREHLRAGPRPRFLVDLVEEGRHIGLREAAARVLLGASGRSTTSAATGECHHNGCCGVASCPPGGRFARREHVERHDDLSRRCATVVAGLQRSVPQPLVDSENGVTVVHRARETR